MEHVCLCVARLVDNFFTDERILKEIAAHGLLTSLQQLVPILVFVAELSHDCIMIFFLVKQTLSVDQNRNHSVTEKPVKFLPLKIVAAGLLYVPSTCLQCLIGYSKLVNSQSGIGFSNAC